jgi:hypothetical protein
MIQFLKNIFTSFKRKRKYVEDQNDDPYQYSVRLLIHNMLPLLSKSAITQLTKIQNILSDELMTIQMVKTSSEYLFKHGNLFHEKIYGEPWFKSIDEMNGFLFNMYREDYDYSFLNKLTEMKERFGDKNYIKFHNKCIYIIELSKAIRRAASCMKELRNKTYMYYYYSNFKRYKIPDSKDKLIMTAQFVTRKPYLHYCTTELLEFCKSTKKNCPLFIGKGQDAKLSI